MFRRYFYYYDFFVHVCVMLARGCWAIIYAPWPYTPSVPPLASAFLCSQLWPFPRIMLQAWSKRAQRGNLAFRFLQEESERRKAKAAFTLSLSLSRSFSLMLCERRCMCVQCVCVVCDLFCNCHVASNVWWVRRACVFYHCMGEILRKSGWKNINALSTPKP